MGPIELVFLLAPLAVVPLGLALAEDSDPEGRAFALYGLARRLQPIAAILVVASFYPPAGVLAAAMVVPWAVVAGISGLCGVLRLYAGGFQRLDELCFGAGLVFFPVGAGWLFLSRLGAAPMGFFEPIVLLTAVHFHFTGFAAPILVGAAGRALGEDPAPLRGLFRAAAIGLVGGTPLLAAGWVFSPALKLAAALLLAASLIAFSLITLVLATRQERLSVRVLLGISGLSLLAGMSLAAVYAVGEFTGRFWLVIPQMAMIHGPLNAFGFTLCGLLGWRLRRGLAR